MKFLIILALVAAAVAIPADQYDSKYDNFNLDEVIDNERLLKGYVHCYNGEGKCTPEAGDFKRLLPEAVESGCGKCSDKQKELVAKSIIGVRDKLPLDFKKLLNKYDPGNKHADTLKNFLSKYSA